MIKTYKNLALCLILVLILSDFTPCFAQKNASISQQEAIIKVKNIFDTANYDKFNINYTEQRGRKIWELDWSRSKKPYDSLNVTVDERGDITTIYNYIENKDKSSPIPSLSENMALRKAQEFIKKIQPNEFTKVKLVENKNQSIHINQDFYIFEFTRMENNIPVENNGFHITIDANTGEIRNYQFDWFYDTLPSPEGIISKDKAEKIFKNLDTLNLAYKKFPGENTKNNIKLVYTLKNPEQILIDAKTGELIKEEFSLYYASTDKDMGISSEEFSFTPQEQKEIEISKDCITRDDAIKIVKKHIKIPKNCVISHARLHQDYYNPNEKIWCISWGSKSPDKDTSGNARVNAITSELISFNIYHSNLDQKDFKQNYDRNAALKRAQTFIKKIQPEKYKNVKLIDKEKNIIRPTKDERVYYFDFIRKIDEIPYIGNGFSICVDSETGEIISYNMNWHDVDLPKAENVMSKDKAYSRFLENIGLELKYILIYNPDKNETESFLTYKLKESNSLDFDAINLKPLDFKGDFIEEKPETIFTDIKGHWAQSDIELLVDLGILTSSDNRFRPNLAITEGEFIKLLLLANNHTISDVKEGSKEEIQKYIDLAIKLGWVKKDEVKANNPLQREKMAAFLVRSLDFERIASIPEIFNVMAKDSKAVSAKYKGHVSIGLGLNLLTCHQGCFSPKQNVSRAEAVTSIVRSLKLER